MGFDKGGFSSQFKRNLVVIYIVLAVIILLVFFTGIFETSADASTSQVVPLLVFLILLFAVIMVLSKLFKVLEAVKANAAKLEEIISMTEKNRQALLQLEQNARLSEAVKAITFSNENQQSLRQAVFAKLQQKDFEVVNKIIADIYDLTPYKELAQQLQIQANRYRDSSDHERTNQVINHIEQLLEEYKWTEASDQVEKLIDVEPESEKLKEMRQKLIDKKAERKKILLTAWDDAVKRQATDRSLEILKELDMYLTPNEGIALQEAARDVFRNKLHNIGVQFSLAVSGKQWDKAIKAGKQIIHDFPNSKMAGEIRDSMDTLKEKSRQ
jgi:ABC-type multidrug transport system fused ATPase/permease subunit